MSLNVSEKQKLLVIKLGALGDFIQATGAMAAIRRHHPDAHITLLTTKPFENFARLCGYFDDIWIDQKPRPWNIPGWLTLKNKFDAGNFSRVYDLQNNDRTAFYLRLFSNRPEWVGAAPGASHRNTSPERTSGHAFDGHIQTLALAGITGIEIDPLSWLDESIASFGLQKPYILLVPGSAPERPEKRWPAAHYARLTNALSQWGYQPVILGTRAEENVAREIADACPAALDLTGQTSLGQIASMGRGAAAAIGNDTGPVHLLAATGCPVLVLFSRHSNPLRHAPKGPAVQLLQANELNELPEDIVLKALRPREDPPKKSVLLH